MTTHTTTDEENTMAVPKRKLSRSNTRHRRSAWKAARPDLVPVTVAGEVHLLPRRLARAAHRGLIDPTTGRKARR